MLFFGRKAFVLIAALWTLMFLAVLVVTLLAGVRQKIVLFQRLEARAREQLAIEAGAKKAIAVLLDDLENNQFSLTPSAKQRRMNNSGEFSDISLGGLRVEVVHPVWNKKRAAVEVAWGMADEQSKININIAPRDTIQRLIIETMGWGKSEASELADAIADWRDYGKHQAEGFFSDDYYKSLEFPYAMKDEPFERIDELLLVKGVDAKAYALLLPFVTAYGDGRININTAPEEVLVALGLDAVLADKILKVRRGMDGVEATADDHIFMRTFDIAAEVSRIVKLGPDEVRQIDALNAGSILGTESGTYSFTSRLVTASNSQERSVACVFAALESRVVYWYEK